MRWCHAEEHVSWLLSCDWWSKSHTGRGKRAGSWDGLCKLSGLVWTGKRTKLHHCRWSIKLKTVLIRSLSIETVVNGLSVPHQKHYWLVACPASSRLLVYNRSGSMSNYSKYLFLFGNWYVKAPNGFPPMLTHDHSMLCPTSSFCQYPLSKIPSFLTLPQLWTTHRAKLFSASLPPSTGRFVSPLLYNGVIATLHQNVDHLSLM